MSKFYHDDDDAKATAIPRIFSENIRTKNCVTLSFEYRILTHLRYIVVENIVRKGEIACNKQFLIFSQCFLPYMTLIFHLNPFPDKPWFLRVYSRSRLKTLWEKKLLVTSNILFSLSVFYWFRELIAIFIEPEIIFRKLLKFRRV